jgi:hypothetical protein
MDFFKEHVSLKKPIQNNFSQAYWTICWQGIWYLLST